MNLTGAEVVVTGASGFCGAAVARAAAAAGARVRCLGRRPGPVGRHVPWDATRDLPDLAGADLVVHLAAAVGDPVPGRAAERAYRAVNIDGTARLLDAAGSRPLVWVSSASVYRPGGAALVTEDHPVDGQLSAYGRTKAAGERLALAAGAVVLRPRAVYGPGDPHLLPRLLRARRAGWLPVPGPDVRLSLTAVENLVDAVLAAPGWPAGPYNVADARPYSRDAVLRGVLAATGAPARLAHLPVGLAGAAATAATTWSRLTRRAPVLTGYAVDQLARDMVLDISRARARGYRPRRTLADHLARLGGEQPGQAG
ncbi:NAD dependent epimerase/dehydratase family protein [Micromonospora sp. MW-13]|uniref:NAD-dependent epimerase/dehydratase family protein n=1 Tax=unclassified Micromonospora TaxID=2617518 RepID=UPI000EE10CEA|nr:MULTISPECIES: NAD-dependent epimerase/dehydratase family protein [unclassified Micromonospora]MCX4471842.1 NAD-dependent epimerase/dehydratase family protein [Micromonospora sp. NBC_01655]RGC66878.1 NAD dependent epimerase/dehydratase family protein [Micromonospora sp. MW-13]